MDIFLLLLTKLTLIKISLEVKRVCTVDHVVGGEALGLAVYNLDGLLKKKLQNEMIGDKQCFEL